MLRAVERKESNMAYNTETVSDAFLFDKSTMVQRNGWHKMELADNSDIQAVWEDLRDLYEDNKGKIYSNDDAVRIEFSDGSALVWRECHVWRGIHVDRLKDELLLAAIKLSKVWSDTELMFCITDECPLLSSIYSGGKDQYLRARETNAYHKTGR